MVIRRLTELDVTSLAYRDTRDGATVDDLRAAILHLDSVGEGNSGRCAELKGLWAKLSTIAPARPAAAAPAPVSAAGMAGERVELLPRQCFPSPWNRKHFSAEGLEEMARSIEKHGVIQDGLVRPLTGERAEGLTMVDKLRWEELVKERLPAFEIIAGERRWRGADMAGRVFPAKVRDCSDEEAIELQAIENLQREDPNPIEVGEKYAQLLEVYGKRGLTKEAAIAEICTKCDVSRSSVYDGLRLLKLPEKAKRACLDGKLPASHARELSKLEGDADRLAWSLGRVLKKGTREEEEELGETLETYGDEIDRDSAGLLSFRMVEKLVAAQLVVMKNKTAYHKVRAEFEQAGNRILTEAESAKVVKDSYGGSFDVSYQCKEYVKGESQCTYDGAYRTYSKLWKTAPAPVLALLPSGKPAIIYSKAEADKAVKAGGKLQAKASNSGGGGSETAKWKAEQEARKAKYRYKSAVFDELLRRVATAEVDGEVRPGFWRALLPALIEAADYPMQRRVGELRGLGTDGTRGQWQKLAKELNGDESRALMVQLLVAKFEPKEYQANEAWSAELLAVCKYEGVDLAKLEKEMAATAAAPTGKGKTVSAIEKLKAKVRASGRKGGGK